jgi:hypothetical protein
MDWRGSRELAAAIRRFPDRAESVRRLAVRNGAFRDMCEELAAAETALARLEADTATHLGERRLECEGWIARLTDEIAEVLRQPEVIPLPTARPRP